MSGGKTQSGLCCLGGRGELCQGSFSFAQCEASQAEGFSREVGGEELTFRRKDKTHQPGSTDGEGDCVGGAFALFSSLGFWRAFLR